MVGPPRAAVEKLEGPRVDTRVCSLGVWVSRVTVSEAARGQ